MKKVICMLLCILLLSVAFAACKGKDGSAVDPCAQEKKMIADHWKDTYSKELGWFTDFHSFQHIPNTCDAIYLGEFDGFYVLATNAAKIPTYFPVFKIAGYTFNAPNVEVKVFVFDPEEGSDSSLEDAYDSGLVTEDTVRRIYERWVQLGGFEYDREME